MKTRSKNAFILVLAMLLALVPLVPPGTVQAAGPLQAALADLPEDQGNLPNPYDGTDYYIDASGGDDAQDGTSPETAWQSFANANAKVFEPGDRILLKAGEVWEDQQLWPKGSGAPGQPITIDRYGDPEARKPYIALNGNVENPVTWQNGDFRKDKEKVGLTGAIVLRNQQYWEIHNMEISNDDDFDTDISGSARQTGNSYVRDGISITINADLLEDGDDKIMNYFRITNNYIHNIDGPSDWQKIHYGGIIFQVFGEKSYKDYEEGAYYFQDVRIENNHFYKTELHAIQFAFNWFYDRDQASGEYDETGKFHEGWEQLWVRNRDLYSRDVYIGHNYAEDIGQGAIQLANTKDMLVEYNEINGYLQRYDAVSCGLYLWAGADTVMQFNEVYGGPWGEYDGTPWDLEYTNFNVTYQYNYSHDNAAGWMAYMGNSSNSIARYNLSVNDNGVLVKNMLSTNYSPTYFLNNVFVYDAEQMDWFHDEVFIDTVYFLNNVFYNVSETTPTKWYRKPGALDRAVFSNNAFYEAGGVQSPQQPHDPHAVLEDPGFVADPMDYKVDNGVLNIVDSAANYKVVSDSPLIDAGRYNPRVGDEDFFGTHLYYGDSIDIGIHEYPTGERVDNPVDTNPIEEEGQETRPNLALGKPITANYSHPRPDLQADKLVDGSTATRWASADPDDMTEGYPIIITIDFEEMVTFDEIYLDEYTDSGTNLRIQSYELQQYDEEDEVWHTFKAVDDGMGHDVTLDDFGTITSGKLRLLITEQIATEYWSPTMTEIQVYYSGGEETETDPVLSIASAVYDVNEAMAEHENNVVRIEVEPDGDTLTSIRYIGTEGNVLSSLTEGEDYETAGAAYVILPSFLRERALGESGLQFEFASGARRTVALHIVDSTGLAGVLAEARAITPGSTSAYAALAEAIGSAQEVLDLANRTVSGSGNDAVTHTDLQTQAQALRQAIDRYREAIRPPGNGWIYYPPQPPVPQEPEESETPEATEDEEPSEGTPPVTAEPAPNEPELPAFADMDGHWAEGAVRSLRERGIVNGMGDGQFHPGLTTTRAQFTAMLVRALGLQTGGASSGSFADVPPAAWYSDVIHAAHASGLVNGMGDGTFRPSQPVTRQEAMVLLAQALELSGLREPLEPSEAEALLRAFTDREDVAIWALPAVADSLRSSLVQGRTQTTLAPQAQITRAEAAVMLQRLLEL
ncbi:S-layer homology domain-containing protein [Paenibacillus sp. 1P07SE]|uniref:S-layer homology domain-containing protein n=1 Tax=Paenibacillus sp. 1P07SE TaxID=3132209 RepID=UPI0039A77247